MIVRTLRIEHTNTGRQKFWNRDQLIRPMPELANIEIPIEAVPDVGRHHGGHGRRHHRGGGYGGYYPYYNPYDYLYTEPIYLEPSPPVKSKSDQLIDYFGAKKAGELIAKLGVEKAYKQLPANLQVSYSVDGAFGDKEYFGWLKELSENGKPAIKAILAEMNNRFWRLDPLTFTYVPRLDKNFVYAAVQLLYHLNEKWDALSKTNLGIGRIKYVLGLITAKLPLVEQNVFEASWQGIVAGTVGKTISQLAKIPKIAFDVLKWMPFVIIGIVGLAGFIVYKFLKSDTGKQIIHGATMGVAKKYLPIAARVGRGKRKGSRKRK
jgi:hypothetical protein